MVLPGNFIRIKRQAQRVAASSTEALSSVSLRFYALISTIFTHLPVSKQPIPQRVLSEWKHNPLPIAMGLGDMEVDDEVGQQTHGRASKVRPKPKKGLDVISLPLYILTVKKFLNLGVPMIHC